jgi:membrane fusion protein (multidrug efflux system)
MQATVFSTFPGLATGLAAVYLLAGCSPEAQKQAPPPVPEVLVTTPVQRDVPMVREWLATLDGSANVVVKPRVQGYLTKTLYTAGAEVKEGAVMFEIDPRPFDAALAQAEADLARNHAVQVKAELDANRQINLYASKAVSEQDRDAAVQNNEAAKANVLAAEAAVELAKINLEFTKITAPVTGIAGIAKPGTGDLVGPTGAELATISAVNPIKAIFQLSEQQYLRGEKLLNSAIGQPLEKRPADLELVLSTGEVFPHKGKFFTADRQVDQKTGTITVETLFPNPGNVLRPGFFARVRSIVDVEKNALLVPQRAVAETQGNYHLAIVGEGDLGEIRPVTVGERVGPMWVITSGLKPGELVVVEGIQKVKAGKPVVPKPWSAPEPRAAAPAPVMPAAPAPAPAAQSESK